MTKEQYKEIKKRIDQGYGYSLEDLRKCVEEIDRLRSENATLALKHEAECNAVSQKAAGDNLLKRR